MRQTLLRFVPDWWTCELQTNPAQLGTGFLLLAWIAYGGFWLYRQRRAGGRQQLNLSAPAVWLLIAALIYWIPGQMQGGVPVYGYGFMMFLGFVCGGWWATVRARSVGIPTEAIWDAGLWIFFGGVAGARLFYLVQYRDRVFANKHGSDLIKAAVNLSDGGLVFYGGMVLGAVAYWIYCRRSGMNPLLLGDVAMPSVFLGMACGRFGCLLNGCCFGDRCELPWAIQFPRNSVPFNALVNRGFLDPQAAYSLPLHPTQIYSSINALVLAAITAAYFRSRPRNGAVLAVGFIAYPISRLVIELLRGDEMGQFGTSLTIAQWVSLGVSLCSLIYLCVLLRGTDAGDSRPASA